MTFHIEKKIVNVFLNMLLDYPYIKVIHFRIFTLQISKNFTIILISKHKYMNKIMMFTAQIDETYLCCLSLSGLDWKFHQSFNNRS